MRKRIARLFTIKTRTEAWLIIYAIALGSVERGRAYLDMYPGAFGWALALACTGVVFLAGAKLLDSVAPAPARALAGPYRPRIRRAAPLSRSRPRRSPMRSGSESRSSLRKD